MNHKTVGCSNYVPWPSRDQSVCTIAGTSHEIRETLVSHRPIQLWNVQILGHVHNALASEMKPFDVKLKIIQFIGDGGRHCYCLRSKCHLQKTNFFFRSDIRVNDVDKSLLLMIAFNEIELMTEGWIDGAMLTDIYKTIQMVECDWIRMGIIEITFICLWALFLLFIILIFAFEWQPSVLLKSWIWTHVFLKYYIFMHCSSRYKMPEFILILWEVYVIWDEREREYSSITQYTDSFD